MPKAKNTRSITGSKKCMNAWSPERDILAAVQEFVKSGTHSQIEFSGTPLEFATALYVSRFSAARRGRVSFRRPRRRPNER